MYLSETKLIHLKYLIGHLCNIDNMYTLTRQQIIDVLVIHQDDIFRGSASQGYQAVQ